MIIILLFLAAIRFAFSIRKEMGWPAAIVFSGMVLVVLSVPIFCTGREFEKEIGRENKKQNIYSIRNGTDFYLGRYSFGSEENYTIFKKDERGGLTKISISAENNYIFQDENESPYVAWQRVSYSFPKWIHIWPKIVWEKDTAKDIHVPTNTVIETFKIE